MQSERENCKTTSASEWSAHNMFEHAATGFCCTLKARETLDRHVGLALFKARICHDGQTPGAMPRGWLSCANVRQGIIMYANDAKELNTKAKEMII